MLLTIMGCMKIDRSILLALTKMGVQCSMVYLNHTSAAQKPLLDSFSTSSTCSKRHLGRLRQPKWGTLSKHKKSLNKFTSLNSHWTLLKPTMLKASLRLASSSLHFSYTALDAYLPYCEKRQSSWRSLFLWAKCKTREPGPFWPHTQPQVSVALWPSH